MNNSYGNIFQLQTFNQLMKEQLKKYPVDEIAGSNRL